MRRPTKSLNLVKKLGIETTILEFLLFVVGWEIGKEKSLGISVLELSLELVRNDTRVH